MFCTNCGAPQPDGAKFCRSCGAPLTAAPAQQPAAQQQSPYQQPGSPPPRGAEGQAWRQHATAEENAAVSGTRVSPNVYLGSDGKYRWVYEMKFRGNPVARRLVQKILAYILIPAGLVLGLIIFVTGDFDLESTLQFLGIWAAIVVFCELLIFIVMPIVSAIYKGSYYTIYELDGATLTQIQMNKTFQRTQAAALIFLLTSDDLMDMMSSIKMGTKDRYDTNLARASAVRLYPKYNMIDVGGLGIICQVYAEPEDHDFVLDYILQHIPEKTAEKFRSKYH